MKTRMFWGISVPLRCPSFLLCTGLCSGHSECSKHYCKSLDRNPWKHWCYTSQVRIGRGICWQQTLWRCTDHSLEVRGADATWLIQNKRDVTLWSTSSQNIVGYNVLKHTLNIIIRLHCKQFNKLFIVLFFYYYFINNINLFCCFVLLKIHRKSSVIILIKISPYVLFFWSILQ